MKGILLVCCAFISCSLFGQVADDFSDGDYTTNPSWSGDNGKFAITDGQLNSLNTGAATYYLSTPSTLATEAEWGFFINLKFSTSGANFVDIYLVSDQADLNATTNGYFVRVGNTADEISLYKLEAGIETVLIDGSDGLVNSSSNNPFNIRVKRDNNNLWVLETDDGATGSYETQGTVVDNSINSSTYFGFKIKQSSAASPVNKHFFDNISVTVIIPDTQPPTLLNAEAVSLFALELKFDEPLDQSSAESLSAYTVDQGVGNPISANLDPISLASVQLIFGNPFVNNKSYQVETKNISDLNGNNLLNQTLNFEVLIPEIAEAEDIIITEIMADPTPKVGLPEAEYVEIYNKSDKYIDIAGFTLSGKQIASSRTIIYPKQYAILCDEDDQGHFVSYGDVIGINGWSSLTNSGKVVGLESPADDTIDQVTYSDGWYQSNSKKDGGWSLELIDIQNECGEESNWLASIDDSGGTPGESNSVAASKPDLTGPKLLAAYGISDDEVLLLFDEKLEVASVELSSFNFEPALNIADIRIEDNVRGLTIILENIMTSGTDYQLIINQLRDCNGNLIGEQNQAVFRLTEGAELGDLLINEVLFDPTTDGGEFIELYNNSGKYINLKKWQIANSDDAKLITSDHLVIAPAEYLAFTAERLVVASDYPKSETTQLVEVAALPSLPNEKQQILILDSLDIVLDQFEYFEDFHHPLLSNTKGVSLERISVDGPTSDPNNWHSAAKSVGFATPGYANSQALGDQPGNTGIVSVLPQVFLPNQSGTDDFTSIQYDLGRSGFVATISILDTRGRLIKSIASNQLLGAEGFFQWDGTMDNGNKARSGAYIVYFSAFDNSGNVETHKKRVVIAPEF